MAQTNWRPPAKKLKQSWVEAQKIKSNWKAQKRKEGLVHPSRLIPPSGDDGGENEMSGNEGMNGDRLESEKEDGVRGSAARQPDSKDASDHSSESEDDSENKSDGVRQSPEPGYPTRERNSRGRGAKGRGGSMRNDKQKDEDAGKEPSLRDLHKLAYSRSSLHTFKSSRGHRGLANAGKADGRGRGTGRGFQGSRGRGRGQPDMRLRMNAMLEKIKRDFT